MRRIICLALLFQVIASKSFASEKYTQESVLRDLNVKVIREALDSDCESKFHKSSKNKSEYFIYMLSFLNMVLARVEQICSSDPVLQKEFANSDLKSLQYHMDNLNLKFEESREKFDPLKTVFPNTFPYERIETFVLKYLKDNLNLVKYLEFKDLDYLDKNLISFETWAQFYTNCFYGVNENFLKYIRPWLNVMSIFMFVREARVQNMLMGYKEPGHMLNGVPQDVMIHIFLNYFTVYMDGVSPMYIEKPKSLYTRFVGFFAGYD